MLYVDTSIIVSVLTKEKDTALSQTWLARQATSELTISDWTTTEFASALSIKLRMGALGADHRAAVLSAFTRLCAESLRTLLVAREDFRRRAVRGQVGTQSSRRRRSPFGDLRQSWSVALHPRSTPGGRRAARWRAGAESYAIKIVLASFGADRLPDC